MSSFEIVGDCTTARVMGLNETDLDEATRGQLEKMVNHPSFQNPIRVMPDCHGGSGAVIGFTMPLGDRITPNVVGSDIGCGMIAITLADTLTELGLTHEEIDRRVRAKVPMGWGETGVSAPNRDYYHFEDDFPWETLNNRAERFVEIMDAPYVDSIQEFLNQGGYDVEYFRKLVSERAGQDNWFDLQTAIQQVGTLGGGNHFIEICESEETGDNWVVIHSGSRGLGSKTAKFWQREAIRLRDDRADRAREQLREFPAAYVTFDIEEVNDQELLNWLHGENGKEFINYDAIPRKERETVRKELKAVIPDEDLPKPSEALDHLKEDEAAGYLLDMLFCQEYAKENRLMMARATADVLGTDIIETIHARHNIVDFRDGIIRKGATRAYEDERVVVPFNMSEGALLVEGRSNDEWNKSVCHGAGRVMSRREAERQFTEAEVRNQIEAVGAYASELPLDEAPGAYKDTALIEGAIHPTAKIVDRLHVLHNFKSSD